ncbi:PREDICTED: meiotic recombination protein REC114-like [Priapulus caudatus]|uniref:Meiotic recombination protein REC114-like n=1 Tax=Priapulus caudatus TaxID=37621 RepID=A0ABM1EN92_PRICU|nr:PREDICTED: meiotic recombination protein REC114-like [Priapulus caudatus]
MYRPASSSNKSSWNIHKYARFYQKPGTPENTNASGYWKYFEDVILAVTENNCLMLMKADIILESYSLWNSMNQLKGMWKGDSLLIICKSQNEARKFRVKFHSNEEKTGNGHCLDCVQMLSSYFLIKPATEATQEDSLRDDAETQDMRACSKTCEELAGTVPLKTLAQSVLANQGNLPLPYQEATPYASCDDRIQNAVRTCLTDPQFPQFVAKVEEHLIQLLDPLVTPNLSAV